MQMSNQYGCMKQLIKLKSLTKARVSKDVSKGNYACSSYQLLEYAWIDCIKLKKYFLETAKFTC